MKLYDDFVSFRLLTQPYIKNWWEVLLFRFGVITDLRIKTKRGKEHGLERFEKELNFDDVRFAIDDKKQFNQTLHLILDNFVAGQYARLPVKGNVVVDIGACIGDTAIYFALKDAKHVYAYEPYPYTYEIAKKNINMNNIGAMITLFNEGVSNTLGHVRLDKGIKAYGDTELRSARTGELILVTTLKVIADENQLKDACLKLDAEGAEYQVILHTDTSTLRRFRYIMLEYHDGFKLLKEKLVRDGFKVKVFPSTDIYYRAMPNKQGLLFAERAKQRRVYKDI